MFIAVCGEKKNQPRRGGICRDIPTKYREKIPNRVCLSGSAIPISTFLLTSHHKIRYNTDMENSTDGERSASDAGSLPHQQFDIVAKDPFYVFPEDMLRFLMNRFDFEFIEHVDSNLTTVEVRHMDVLIKVRLEGQPVLIHCEIQTDDSRSPNMVRRNVGYLGRCYEKYGLPIYSFVLYLRSTAGHEDPGGYFQNVPGHRIIVEYQVIRLSEIDGQSILASSQPGLMPFTPLMKPPASMSGLEWTAHCAEVTQSLELDTVKRNNLLVELWVMSGLAHDRQNLLSLIPEEIMNNSTVYEMIIERGIEQGKKMGAKEFAIERIRYLLNRRFNISMTDTLMTSLEEIDDLQHLSQLMDAAAEAEYLENFRQTLETFQNGA